MTDGEAETGGRRRAREPSPAPLTALRGLAPEMRMAGYAALGLVLTMALPWYDETFFDTRSTPPQSVSRNLSAFQIFTFVEAAVLLVAAAVLYLVWARAQRRGFHLPGGDGLVIVLAGGWVELLLLWRWFDKPESHERAGHIGIQWGMFVAMVAAGFMIAAGARVRAAHRPEPPNPAEDLEWEGSARRRPADTTRAPRDPTAVTQVLGERPSWEGEVREPPGRAERPPPEERPDPDRPTRPDDPDADRLF